MLSLRLGGHSFLNSLDKIYGKYQEKPSSIPLLPFFHSDKTAQFVLINTFFLTNNSFFKTIFLLPVLSAHA